MKILVLGATGMLGNAMVRTFAETVEHDVIGAVRGGAPERLRRVDGLRLISGLNAESPDSLAHIIARAQPDVVVNAVGVVKQLDDAKSVLASAPLNSLLPHRLAKLCAIAGARLIHISTDCVFTGKTGNYNEDDVPDAVDVYGRSKLLGEVGDETHVITLRTSIIGPELRGGQSLLEWFLRQQGQCMGFRSAIFSGLPTVELSRVVRDVILARPDLHGLYNVSAEPIDKFTLLQLIAAEYGKDIEIIPSDELIIDRSLDSTRFRTATGWQPDDWPTLIAQMHAFG